MSADPQVVADLDVVYLAHMDLRLVKTPLYQRPLSLTFVKKIAKEFHPTRYLIPLLSKRDGDIWMVDGSHRVAGAIMAKQPIQPVLLVSGLTLEAEASLFIDQTRRRAVSPLSRVLAGLVKGDPACVEMTEILERHDYAWARGSEAGAGGRLVGAAAAVTNVYHANPQLLESVMSILHDAWGADEELTGQVIMGLAAFLRAASIPKVDRARLVGVLAKIRYAGWKQRAWSINVLVACNSGGSAPIIWAAALAKEYNTRLSPSKRITGDFQGFGGDR